MVIASMPRVDENEQRIWYGLAHKLANAHLDTDLRLVGRDPVQLDIVSTAPKRLVDGVFFLLNLGRKISLSPRHHENMAAFAFFGLNRKNKLTLLVPLKLGSATPRDGRGCCVSQGASECDDGGLAPCLLYLDRIYDIWLAFLYFGSPFSGGEG